MPSAPADSPVLRAIFERRSVRKFTDATVDRAVILQALQAAAWAPSGLNNQPWRFAVVWDSNLKASLAALNDVERYRVGMRQGLQFTGRERLAQAHYHWATQHAANVAAWNVAGKQVVLKDNTGNVVARLYSSGAEKYDGQTATGQPISFTR